MPTSTWLNSSKTSVSASTGWPGISGSLRAALMRLFTASTDTALRLARYFATSATYWMNLQDQYKLEIAEALSGDRIRSEIRCLAE